MSGLGADVDGPSLKHTRETSIASDLGRSVFVIFNPASGRGSGRKKLSRYLELLSLYLPQSKHAVTTRPGEEAEIADRAIAAGFRTIVAAGGDGTWSQTADRIMASGQKGVRFGMIPSGTGNDFGRSLGINQAAPEEAFRIIAAGKSRMVDVGRVLSEVVRADTPRARPAAGRHFLNLVGFGFDIAVIDAARRARLLSGAMLYKLTALQQLFRYPGFDVELDGRGGIHFEGKHMMLTISNGRYFGGGFPIAPDASVSDSKLHACVIRDASPMERLNLFNMAEKGEHGRSPRVRLVASQGFRARFPKPPRFEVDGDVYQASSGEVEVEVMPAAMEVVVPG
jgi:diacylglycerol kinase (ATP)